MRERHGNINQFRLSDRRSVFRVRIYPRIVTRYNEIFVTGKSICETIISNGGNKRARARASKRDALFGGRARISKRRVDSRGFSGGEIYARNIAVSAMFSETCHRNMTAGIVAARYFYRRRPLNVNQRRH